MENNRKNKICRIFSVIMCLIVTIGLINAASGLLEVKNSYVKNIDFIEEKKDFDVLFLGTSHVINGVVPMQLYNEQGITSYNLAGHAHTIATSYWVLRNALDYTTPKLVVIDADGIEKDIKPTKESFTHESFDAFRLSPTKIEAMYDLYSDEDFGTRFGMIFKYAFYHGRWSDLEKKDFVPECTPQMGGDLLYGCYENEIKVPNQPPIDNETVNTEYFQKIIDECKGRGIDVMVLYMPTLLDETEMKGYAKAKKIAEKNDIKFLSVLEADIVDEKTDFYDASHLNLYGADKATKYIGDYIIKNYNIPDHRNEADYDGWNKKYSEFALYKDRLIEEESNKQ